MKIIALLLAMTATPAHAAALDGAQLSLWWAVPFVGTLLSIALGPLLAPHVWHQHFGKITAAWALAFLAPFALVFGPAAAGATRRAPCALRRCAR